MRTKRIKEHCSPGTIALVGTRVLLAKWQVVMLHGADDGSQFIPH